MPSNDKLVPITNISEIASTKQDHGGRVAKQDKHLEIPEGEVQLAKGWLGQERGKVEAVAGRDASYPPPLFAFSPSWPAPPP